MTCMFEWAWGSLHSVTQALRPVSSVPLRHVSPAAAERCVGQLCEQITRSSCMYSVCRYAYLCVCVCVCVCV